MFKINLNRYVDKISLEGYGPNAGRWALCRWNMLVGMGKFQP